MELHINEPVGLGAAGTGEDFVTIFEPLDLWVGNPIRVAVEGEGLVLRHRHGQWVLRDVRRTKLTWNKGQKR